MGARGSWFSSPALLAKPLASAGVTPNGSPFTHVAASNGAVIVSGGTVSLVELGRGGAFVSVGLVAGALPVVRGDSVRVTYAVAPTITFFQGHA